MVSYSDILWGYNFYRPDITSSPFGAPDLSIVARFGVTWLVKAFIDRGDDLSRRYLSLTALDEAALYGHLDTVKSLYYSGMYQAEATSGALLRAMRGRHLGVTQFLLVQSRAIPKELEFLAAINLGDFQIFETLASELPVSSESDFCMGKALIRACSYEDRDDFVRLLLQEDQNWVISKVDRGFALAGSAKYGSLSYMSMLLPNKLDANALGYVEYATALASCSTVERAKMLLEAGLDPNWVNLHGCTPLGLAIDRRWHDLIRLLVKHGADPECVCDGYNIALDYAVQSGDKACVQILLELGADPRSCFPYHYIKTEQQSAYAIVAESQNKTNSTPLEYFVEWGRPFQVVRLFVRGVDPASCSSSVKRRPEMVNESSYQQALELVLEAQRLHHDKVAYQDFVKGLIIDWDSYAREYKETLDYIAGVHNERSPFEDCTGSVMGMKR
jgi:ankyrin repeat protein